MTRLSLPILGILLLAPTLDALEVRRTLPGVTIVARSVGGKTKVSEMPVKVGKDGRFRVEKVPHGMWELTVKAPVDDMDRWVEQELKALGLTVVDRRPVEKASGSDAGPEPGVASDPKVAGASEGGSSRPEVRGENMQRTGRALNFTAKDSKGIEKKVSVAILSTVEKPQNKSDENGNYVKQLHPRHLRGEGMPVRFRVGNDSGGVITGSIERVITIH